MKHKKQPTNKKNKLSILPLVVSISALLVAIIAIYFNWQGNQFQAQGNTIAERGINLSRELGICNQASIRLEESKFMVKNQYYCNLSNVQKNIETIDISSRHLVEGNCNKTMESLSKLNYTQCDNPQALIGGITGRLVQNNSSWMLTAGLVVIIILLILFLVKVYKGTRLRKKN